MNSRIWKFPLEVVDTQIVRMPINAIILDAQMQHGELCMWALVNADIPLGERRINIYGTGNPLPENYGRYISTVQSPAGMFVWHIFDM